MYGVEVRNRIVGGYYCFVLRHESLESAQRFVEEGTKRLPVLEFRVFEER